jgi:lipopolysaccharide transport system permease protein
MIATRDARWSRTVELIRMSSLRQLKARYRGSFLGVLWSFANPILMTGLYTTIFGTAFASYYGGSTHRYVFSAFVAVVIVSYFLQTTGEALVSVVSNGGLLNKIQIEPETFPVAAVAANTFQHAVTTFPVILILSAFVTRDPIRIALVPIELAAVIALVTGFGLVLASLYVFFRDLSYLWAVIGFVLWMTSPAFYPAALVPVNVRPWLELNPIGLAVGALREVTLGTGPIAYALVATSIAVGVFALAAGHVVFRSLRPQFMDLL